ncbi:MAG: hypothetical protein H0X11_09985 [Betaproteobacteria bacterium]|nr:hypothetical protein [Betaproteobacteria bacterium]
MSLARRTTIVAARGGSFVVERRTMPQRHVTPVNRPDRTLVAKLDELASRVRRLTISSRDPERFFEDRSEIAAELQRLAGAIQV